MNTIGTKPLYSLFSINNNPPSGSQSSDTYASQLTGP
jgi:hypothetical protein